MPEAIEFEAGAADAGRLDAVLARRAGISRAQAARLIAEEAVTVDGAPAGKSLRVRPGMRIVASLPEEALPPGAEPMPLRVVYEDEALLVVSKPAGLVVHPGPGRPSGTLVNALLARDQPPAGGAPERPGIVHRLDAGTSGLMIVTKTEQAHRRLAGDMSARRVTRVYLALGEGAPETDTLTIDAPIGRSPRHRKKMAVVAGGRDARTRVAVLERHRETALLEVRPETGRTHQIRVHLAAAGHPIAGDVVYGRRRALARTLALDRPFLHAARLAFRHPVSGAPVELEEPLPPDLAAALVRARGA